VRKFASAILEGGVFANAHQDRTLPYLVEVAKIDPAVAKRSRRELFAETLDPALIQSEIDALVRLKILDRGFSAKEMISAAILR
jgi:hypothetical protein